MMILDEDNNILKCDVCCAVGSIKQRASSGIYNYDFSSGTDFTETPQPTIFSNLKQAVSRYIGRQVHINNLKTKTEVNEQLHKLQAKEQNIGVTLGKQCYRLLKYYWPFADCEVDVKLLSDAKVKVGNVNHSHKFASELGPAFAEAIDSRVKAYINTPLEATRVIPPVGIVADNLTAKRRTGADVCGSIIYSRDGEPPDTSFTWCDGGEKTRR